MGTVSLHWVLRWLCSSLSSLESPFSSSPSCPGFFFHFILFYFVFVKEPISMGWNWVGCFHGKKIIFTVFSALSPGFTCLRIYLLRLYLRQYIGVAGEPDRSVGDLEGISSAESRCMVALRNPFTLRRRFPRSSAHSLMEGLQVSESICLTSSLVLKSLLKAFFFFFC